MKWRPVTRTVGNARARRNQHGVTLYDRDAGGWYRVAWFRYAADARDYAAAVEGRGDLAAAIDATSGSWSEYAAAQGAADKEATSLGYATRNLTDDAKKAKRAIDAIKGAFDELNGKARSLTW